MNFLYISPHSSESPPNIGKAINDAVIRLNPNDNDWIIHTDQDALFLLPKDRNDFEHALSTCDYDVVGTLTNRLNPSICKHQVVSEMYNEYDIRKHIEYAKKCEYGFILTDVVALVCMAFRYKYWREVGGFKENVPTLDIEFTKQGNCAIYTGVYIFHVYRMYGSIFNINHLIK